MPMLRIILNSGFIPKIHLSKNTEITWKLPCNDKETSILNLTLRDFNVKKGVAFLNKLTEVYQLDNLEKKNENANRTIQFISSQLESISDSLNVSENRMESFQSEHQVLDISMQSQQLLEQMRDLDQERVALETQNKYYHYLREYITPDASQEWKR
jgi:tyrosine-protein kinase Etk/Wzc